MLKYRVCAWHACTHKHAHNYAKSSKTLLMTCAGYMFLLYQHSAANERQGRRCQSANAAWEPDEERDLPHICALSPFLLLHDNVANSRAAVSITADFP